MNENARHLQNLLFVIGVVGIGCFTTIVTTWIRYRARRVVSADLSSRLGEIAETVAKLDNAVDSIVVEVERISENQRFVTKVLAERGTTPAISESIRAGGSTPGR